MPAPALLWPMVRPGFLVVTAVGCVLGWALAQVCGCALHPATALSTLCLALMAHAGGNVLNDYHDARNGSDAANHSALYPFTGGSRFIQQGQVSARQTLCWAWLLLGGTALGGMALAWWVDAGLWWIGGTGLLLAWAYSAPPLRLMERGGGEVAVAAVWWLVVLGSYQVQSQRWSLIAAWTALGYALLVANVLLINGFPDAEADRQAGKHTLVVRWGPDRAAALYALFSLLAHGLLLWGIWCLVPPASAAWGLLSWPVSLLASVQLWRHRREPAQLRPAIQTTILAAVCHGLALSAGLWWG